MTSGKYFVHLKEIGRVDASAGLPCVQNIQLPASHIAWVIIWLRNLYVDGIADLIKRRKSLKK